MYVDVLIASLTYTQIAFRNDPFHRGTVPGLGRFGKYSLESRSMMVNRPSQAAPVSIIHTLPDWMGVLYPLRMVGVCPI